MKIPNTSRIESFIRRLLDSSISAKLVYFESAVLADSVTLNEKSHYIFIVTDDLLLWCTKSDRRLNPLQCYRLIDLVSVELLNDPAKFFAPELANQTQHIAIKLNLDVPTTTTGGLIDLYTFYEDTKLYYFLRSAWLMAHQRASLVQYYGQQPLSNQSAAANPANTGSQISTKIPLNKIQALSKSACLVLLESMEKQFLLYNTATNNTNSSTNNNNNSTNNPSTITSITDKYTLGYNAKRDLYDELTITVSQNRLMKLTIFTANNSRFIDYTYTELLSLYYIVKPYINTDSRRVLSNKPYLIIENEIAAIEYYNSIIQFVSKLLSGSEMIQDRVNILLPNYTTNNPTATSIADSTGSTNQSSLNNNIKLNILITLLLLLNLPNDGNNTANTATNTANNNNTNNPSIAADPINSTLGFNTDQLSIKTEYYRIQSELSNIYSTMDLRDFHRELWLYRQKRRNQQFEIELKTDKNKSKWQQFQLDKTKKQNADKRVAGNRATASSNLSPLSKSPLIQSNTAIIDPIKGLIFKDANYEDDRLIDEIPERALLTEIQTIDRIELQKMNSALIVLDCTIIELLYQLIQFFNYCITMKSSTNSSSTSNSNTGSNAELSNIQSNTTTGQLNTTTGTSSGNNINFTALISAGFNLESLFTLLFNQNNSSSFKYGTITMMFHRLSELLILPPNRCISYYCYYFSTVLYRLVVRSTEIRKIIKSESLLNLLYQPVNSSIITGLNNITESERQYNLSNGGTVTPIQLIDNIDRQNSTKLIYFYQQTKSNILQIIEQVNKNTMGR